MPSGRYNDMLTQTSVDRCYMAEIARVYGSKGYPPISKSDITRYAIEGFADALVKNQLTQRVQTTDEATAILQGLLRSRMNPGGRFEAGLIRNLQNEDARLDTIPIESVNGYTEQKSPNTIPGVTEEYLLRLQAELQAKQEAHEKGKEIAIDSAVQNYRERDTSDEITDDSKLAIRAIIIEDAEKWKQELAIQLEEASTENQRIAVRNRLNALYLAASAADENEEATIAFLKAQF